MKSYRFALTLTVVNFILLILLLANGSSIAAPSAPDVIRARAIELVDSNGRIRAQLNAEPNGETIFRLKDANGTIRVKLGASEDGSGLLLANDATEPGVHILANRSGTKLTLTTKNGAKRVIEP